MSQDSRTYGRREFFSALRDQAYLQGHALRNELRGVRMMGLDDLLTAPDEVIREIAPVVRPGLSIRLDGACVLHVTRNQDNSEEAIRELSPHECFIFRQMNGAQTNEAIAGDLARAYALPQEAAFAKTRALFVELARRMVCQPATA